MGQETIDSWLKLPKTIVIAFTVFSEVPETNCVRYIDTRMCPI
jgi:hypothetical protein